MNPLFFNLEGSFEEVAKAIFRTLDIENILEGDSLNVFDGTYYESSVLGMIIRLEKNSYEYEDDFIYTLFVKKNYESSVKTNHKIEDAMLSLILDLLSINLHIDIGFEKDNKLHIVYPPAKK
ncbi:MAG: hypothetical protein ABJB86_19990 [Bacteroidota bacterium]